MLYKILISMFLYGFINNSVAAETVYSQIDERLLLEPDTLQVKQEAAGKVIIYDRVREQTIAKALDKNFDRIQHMMFINSVKEKDNGELEADDDC